jgi:AcrR family transcriptional regulator
MPAPVDHNRRRQEIAEIAWDIISQVGLDAVTIREIAAAAGYSTTIVTHYFASKRELLLYTYQAAAAHAQKRVDQVLAHDAGDLQGYLEALLPLDQNGVRDWRVYFAFWQIAALDADFAAEQRSWMARVRQVIAGILKARAKSDQALRNCDFALLAKRLLTLLQGMAVQAVFDPEEWSAQRQKNFLASEVRSLLATAAVRKR